MTKLRKKSRGRKYFTKYEKENIGIHQDDQEKLAVIQNKIKNFVNFTPY